MPEQKGRTIGAILNKVIERVNSNVRRLRILEQELAIYKSRTTSAEEELLKQRNYINSSLTEANTKISELEEKLLKSENTVKEIISQLKRVATTTKLKEIEEMIEIYNPIKSQFVTREEVDRLVDEKLKS